MVISNSSCYLYKAIGGLFCWITLPKHVSGREVLLYCIDKKVVFVPRGALLLVRGIKIICG